MSQLAMHADVQLERAADGRSQLLEGVPVEAVVAEPRLFALDAAGAQLDAIMVESVLQVHVDRGHRLLLPSIQAGSPYGCRRYCVTTVSPPSSEFPGAASGSFLAPLVAGVPAGTPEIAVYQL